MYKSLLLSSLALAPTLNYVPVLTNNTNTVSQQIIEDDVTQQEESCTVMYVGKKVSTTGKAYCCRCGDSSPYALNLNATIFEHNQLANQTVYGKDGFSWKMPSTTYRYISTPRNPLVRNGLHWEASTINEMGVVSSATLSCYANTDAKAADPYEPKGISEDNLAQIMGATATSAKQAMQTIARIIDEQGSKESNIIMAMDKDEAWLMEIYTGHQYVAIKMPDDKACTIGNEFMLNTLQGYDDIIISPNLFNLAKQKGFADYDGKEAKDENMHMYYTYGGHSLKRSFNDRCHMRTWRGRDLFMKEPGIYSTTTKYDPFFVPDNMPNNKLSVSDIIAFFRDRYESILNNPNDPDHKTFQKAHEIGTLRCVGDSSTYQVHILSVNPNLPKEIAAEETIALSSANYTPFIPLNAGVTSMNEYYTHVSKNFGYDTKSAYYIFKRLNGLADQNRSSYGLPIEQYMANHEAIWQQHYNELLVQIKDKTLDVQRNILTNYCTSVQIAALLMSDALFNDLMWHILNKEILDFAPFASLEYYSYLYGWDFSQENNIVTMKNGNDTIKVDFNYTEKPSSGWIEGKLIKNDEDPIDVNVTVKDGVACIDYENANEYLAKDHKLVEIKSDDYYYVVENSTPSWVIPVAITIPIACLLAIMTPVLITQIKRRKKILN